MKRQNVFNMLISSITFLMMTITGFGQGWVSNSPNTLYSINSTLGTTSLRVGIGVNTPSALFHTNGSLRFQGLTSSNNLRRVLVLDNNDNVFWQDASTFGGAGWTLSGNSVSATDFIGTTNTQDFRIRANNIQRMLVNSSNGFVGVGVNSPQEILHIGGSFRLTDPADQNSKMTIRPSLNVGTLNPGKGVLTATGNPSSVAGQITNRELTHLVIDMPANDAEDSFAIRTDQNINGQIDAQDELAFVVKPKGYVVLGQNRINAALDHRLTLPNEDGWSGRAIARQWDTYSSKRYKENIKEIASPFNILNEIKGVEYDYGKEFGGGHSFGFIAEEVNQIIPTAVSLDKQGQPVGVNYQTFIPILLEAVKMQQLEIKNLRLEIEQLKNQR